MTSLKDRLKDLPLIIAGPILRRTDLNSVTVWMALQKSCMVKLTVYATTPSTSPVGRGEAVYSSGTNAIPTVKLGDNLHVVAVTARPVSGKVPLSGQLYYYDLSFTCAEARFNGKTLTSSDIAVKGSLTYPNFTYPAFVLPPEKLSDLRLVHGSCRKPHGEGGDALAAVDTMLRDATTSTKRPHQLYLTGDQIYADDVPDPLMALLMDAGKALMGAEERLPLVEDVKMLQPGLRSELGHDVARLSNEEDYGKSHLYRLSEYFCMYLFAWSDVLWPSELPTFEEVYPDADFEDDYHKYILHANDSDDDVKGSSEFKQFDRATLQLRFNGERERVKNYRKTLPQVRRALANVPSYMIFDDHEITDDWYLTKRWCENVLGSELGRRVIQNGLLAYAVFQAWGNTPEQFDGPNTNGRKLLNAASEWISKSYDSTQAGASQQEIAKYVGTTDANFDGQELKHTADTLKWHYAVKGPSVGGVPAYQVIVLDTRTYRAYPGAGPSDRCALLSAAGMEEQVGGAHVSDKAELTLVIAPTNVISLGMTELATDFMGDDLWDDPEHETSVGVDRGDPWTAQTEAFEWLLSKLAARTASAAGERRFVILGGDIHYGYAARMQYWAKKPFDPKSGAAAKPLDKELVAVFAHFTSSALKHETFKTRIYHRIAYFPAYYLPRADMWGGWHERPRVNESLIVNQLAYEDDLRSVNRLWALRERPSMLYLTTLPSVCSVEPLPEWRYRVDFIGGKAQNRELKIPAASAAPTTPAEWLTRAVQAGQLYSEYAYRAVGTDIVGVNNVGEITFNWGEGDEKYATQTLWWRLANTDDPKARTVFTVALKLSDTNYPKPTLPQETKP